MKTADNHTPQVGDTVFAVYSGEEFIIDDINFRGWASFKKGKFHSHCGDIIWYSKSRKYALEQKLNRLLKAVNLAKAQLDDINKSYFKCLDEFLMV